MSDKTTPKPLLDAFWQPINSVPDTDPPEGMTPGGAKLWTALRAFGKSGGDPASGAMTQTTNGPPAGWLEADAKLAESRLNEWSPRTRAIVNESEYARGEAMIEKTTIHRRLVEQQSTPELERKQSKAARPHIWTQEDIDLAERAGREAAEKVQWD